MDSKVDKTTQNQKDASQDNRLTALEQYAITTPGEAGQVWMSDGTGAGKWEKVSTGGKMPIVRFTNYSGTIPVVAGCKYSTDGNTWTEVTETGVVPTPFTGWVKFTTEVSGEGYTSKSVVPAPTIQDNTTAMNASNIYRIYSVFTTSTRIYLLGDVSHVYDLNGNPIKQNISTSWRRCGFVLDDVFYTVEGTQNPASIYRIDINGTRTKVGTITLAGTTVNQNPIATFVLDGKTFIIDYNGAAYHIDSDLNVTTIDSGTVRTSGMHFILNDKAHICGGTNASSSLNAHDIYDSNGVRTTGALLPATRSFAATFVLGGRAFICGGSTGIHANSPQNTVYIYDENGNWTTGDNLSKARCSEYRNMGNSNFAVAVGDYGYVIGGAYQFDSDARSSNVIDIYDKNGNRTNPITLITGRYTHGIFVGNGRIFIIGGYKCGESDDNESETDTAEVIDPNSRYTYTLKVPVTEFTEYKIDGVGAIGTADAPITKTKEKLSLTDPKFTWTYEFKYENGNIS